MALLSSADTRWRREYPVIFFGNTSYRADGSHDGVIIESKYIRNKTSPSVATQGIAADITQINADQAVLLVVYDPDRQITDDKAFCDSLMEKSNCIVRVYR